MGNQTKQYKFFIKTRQIQHRYQTADMIKTRKRNYDYEMHKLYIRFNYSIYDIIIHNIGQAQT